MVARDPRGGRRSARSWRHRRDAVGVGITGQWGSTVPVGAGGEAVAPCMLWSDTRGRPLAAKRMGGPVSVVGYSPGEPRQLASPDRRRALPGRRRSTRTPPSSRDSRARALRTHRDAPRAARLPGHALHRPPRRDPGVDDPVLAHRQPAARRATATSGCCCAAQVATLAKLPDLLPTGSVLGGLQPAVASELGLPEGHPGRRRHPGSAYGIYRIRRGRAVRGTRHDQHQRVDRL